MALIVHSDQCDLLKITLHARSDFEWRFPSVAATYAGMSGLVCITSTSAAVMSLRRGDEFAVVLVMRSHVQADHADHRGPLRAT